MVHIRGVGYVCAGSWITKAIHDQWRIVQKQLDDVELMLARLDRLLFDEDSEYSRVHREAYEDDIIRQLEGMCDQTNALLAKFPKARRAKALENATGRTLEEAEAFKAKARALREQIGGAS